MNRPPSIKGVERQAGLQIARRTAGVSILEIEDGKVHRFMAYFNTRDLASQVVDRCRQAGTTRPDDSQL